MKTILVPTDYSEVAYNALDYAIHLAKEEHAEILLLHIFHVPVPTQDSAIPMISFASITDEERTRMEKFRKQVEVKHQKRVRIKAMVEPGLVGDEISSYCQQNKVHLVVMGITGGGAMKEFFMGSNVLSVVKNCGADVLIIPPSAKYVPVRKIALASDLEEVNVDEVSKTLRHYCELFNATTEIINVKGALSTVSEERIRTKSKIHEALSDVDHTIVQPWHDDVVAAIEKHIKSNKIGWLAVVHKEYGFFKNLFHKSITKELAFHTEIPILSINQNK